MRTGFAAWRDDARPPDIVQSLITQIIRLGSVENEVDGIDRNDRRQQGGVDLSANHKVANINLVVRNSSGNRGTHFGPLEVEFGGLGLVPCTRPM